jgi:uncharacterized protein
LTLFLIAIGLVVGILSGMLGIGGGIIMAPLLLYLPALLGLPSFDVKIITGLTMVQGLVGSISGYFAHRKHRIIHKSLIMWTAPPIIVFSFFGAILSGKMNDSILLVVFASMSLIAALLMLIKVKEKSYENDVNELTFNRKLAVLLSTTIGFFGGIVGQGGSFMLVPAMISILKIPTRVAFGTNLAIVLLASLAGIIGKFSTGIVDIQSAFPLICGVIIGSQLGSYLSYRFKTITLKKILAFILFIVSLQIYWHVLVQYIPSNYKVTILAVMLGILAMAISYFIFIQWKKRFKTKSALDD